VLREGKEQNTEIKERWSGIGVNGKEPYVWYWAWRKLNSSLILSRLSAIVNFKGPPPEGGACSGNKKVFNTFAFSPTLDC